MTRKLPADIPSPEERGAHRPDMWKAPEPFEAEMQSTYLRRVVADLERHVNELLK